MRAAAIALATALLALPAAGEQPQAAAACGAFPALSAQAPAGWCAAVVATRKQALRMPRSVLWLGREGGIDQLLVVDLVGWDPGRGRLLHVTVDTERGTTTSRAVLAGLDRPHGLRKGPDGRIWVGEATRISRLDWPPAAGAAPQLQPVVSGLPAEGRHPLKSFAFAPDGTLYINVGAPDDRCEGHAATGADGKPDCPAMRGARPQAAVYAARIAYDQGRVLALEPFATGLRNSMALAVHRSGLVLQAENSIDLEPEGQPPEEVNRLAKGGHYGWPGCVGARQPLPGGDGNACAGTAAPVLLMPAHAAPLHMDYSASFGPAGSTSLVMSWHGHRPAGRRMVFYAVRPDGTPRGAPQPLLHKWEVRDGAHKLAGAPVGWAEDDRGQLWIADDRNRMLVWLRRR